jgi:hypothetical protein
MVQDEPMMELHIWQGIRLLLPEDWEMLLYSRNPREGRCGFADRYGYRVELLWRPVDGVPDFNRMLSDYQSRLLSDGNLKNPKRVSRAGHPGIEGIGPSGVAVGRYAVYLPDGELLIEAIFSWPDSRDAALEAEILKSIGWESSDGEGRRRWRAFGMDMRVLAGLTLKETTIEPAHVELTFADLSGARREWFARLGMVENWLKVPLQDWMDRKTPKGVKYTDKRSVRTRGHGEVQEKQGMRRARGMIGVFGAKCQYDAAAWICPRDERLYACSTLRPVGEMGMQHPQELHGKILKCCDNWS